MQARLYEFIVRSFLATCSKPAVGFETRVEVDIAEELFDACGVLPGTCSNASWQSEGVAATCIHTGPGPARAPCLPQLPRHAHGSTQG